MAESVSRRAALEKAWAERKELPVPMNMLGTAAANWMGFECGFNAAWDALMAEIRPLVAELRIMNPVEYSTDGPHNAATERLRELAREAGE